MKLANVFATTTAAVLMVMSAACSTVPSNEQTQTAEVSAADSLSKDSAAADPTAGSAPSSMDIPAQDPLAAPSKDTSSSMTSAPSSLGASSSGRGH